MRLFARDSCLNPILRLNRTLLLAACCILFAPMFAVAQAPAPDASGLQFNRFADKRPDTLAHKPGGPTERIETIITPDNIDYVTKTYQLKRGHAADLFGVIQGSVALEGGKVFSIDPNIEYEFDETGALTEVRRGGESFLVVTAPQWMIEGLDETIERLDAPGITTDADGTGSRFITMKHRRPSEVAELLSGTAASGFDVIVPDDSNNVLYVEDAPGDFAAIMEALPYFDVPRQTVQLSVKIVEMEQDDAANLGVYWDAWKDALPARIDAELFGGRTRLGDDVTRVREASALLGGISPQAAASFINYLAARGRANIASEPQLQLVQGEQTVIQATTNYPYRALGRDDDGARTLVDAVAETGVVLRVTPFLGSETMDLQIEAVVSNLVGFSQDGEPILSSNSVSGRAILSEGESIVLAGLKRSYDVQTRTGIPFLGSIPGLRFLFSRTVSDTRQTEIMIHLTPVPAEML